MGHAKAQVILQARMSMNCIYASISLGMSPSAKGLEFAVSVVPISGSCSFTMLKPLSYCHMALTIQAQLVYCKELNSRDITIRVSWTLYSRLVPFPWLFSWLDLDRDSDDLVIS